MHLSPQAGASGAGLGVRPPIRLSQRRTPAGHPTPEQRPRTARPRGPRGGGVGVSRRARLVAAKKHAKSSDGGWTAPELGAARGPAGAGAPRNPPSGASAIGLCEVAVVAKSSRRRRCVPRRVPHATAAEANGYAGQTSAVRCARSKHATYTAIIVWTPFIFRAVRVAADKAGATVWGPKWMRGAECPAHPRVPRPVSSRLAGPTTSQ